MCQAPAETRGGAPFYADKALKLGVQVADPFEPSRLREHIETGLAAKNVLIEHFYQRERQSVDELCSALTRQAEQLEPYVCDTDELLDTMLAHDERVLLEGQLGALRDPDHGVYPFSTSSSLLAGFGGVGAGVPPTAFRRIVAVAKACSTCVGATPFPTELSGERADELRRRGGEYGVTTGRPRRLGWFDAVATR